MKKINIAEQSFNPFELIGKDWMLISAGTAEKWNTMTASWGGVGVMWGKPSATCYIRQSRYTKTFVDEFRVFHADRSGRTAAQTRSTFSGSKSGPRHG